MEQVSTLGVVVGGFVLVTKLTSSATLNLLLENLEIKLIKDSNAKGKGQRFYFYKYCTCCLYY